MSGGAFDNRKARDMVAAKNEIIAELEAKVVELQGEVDRLNAVIRTWARMYNRTGFRTDGPNLPNS